jgi:hypothetical protein
MFLEGRVEISRDNTPQFTVLTVNASIQTTDIDPFSLDDDEKSSNNILKKCINRYKDNQFSTLTDVNMFKDLEGIIENKFSNDVYETKNPKTSLPNFIYEEYLAKYGLKSTVISTILTLNHVTLLYSNYSRV